MSERVNHNLVQVRYGESFQVHPDLTKVVHKYKGDNVSSFKPVNLRFEDGFWGDVTVTRLDGLSEDHTLHDGFVSLPAGPLEVRLGLVNGRVQFIDNTNPLMVNLNISVPTFEEARKFSASISFYDELFDGKNTIEDRDDFRFDPEVTFMSWLKHGMKRPRVMDATLFNNTSELFQNLWFTVNKSS